MYNIYVQLLIYVLLVFVEQLHGLAFATYTIYVRYTCNNSGIKGLISLNIYKTQRKYYFKS